MRLNSTVEVGILRAFDGLWGKNIGTGMAMVGTRAPKDSVNKALGMSPGRES
jgi:hypothetical protein